MRSFGGSSDFNLPPHWVFGVINSMFERKQLGSIEERLISLSNCWGTYLHTFLYYTLYVMYVAIHVFFVFDRPIDYKFLSTVNVEDNKSSGWYGYCVLATVWLLYEECCELVNRDVTIHNFQFKCNWDS